MQRGIHASLLLLTIALASCSSGPLDPGERRDLDRARDKWNAHAPPEYTFEFRQSCFCQIELGFWNEVHVRNDSVVSVTPLQPMPPGTTSSLPPSAWPTVPRLFDIIEGSVHSDATADVDATYDPDFGYPRTIEVRCPGDYLDCGAVYTARNLRIVQ